jgi:hypothetical protein
MIERIKRIRLSKNASARLAPFGPPPLITGEDVDAYEKILARVSSQIAPKDLIEEMLLMDIVDLTWEIGRLRRLKAGLFNVGAYQSLSKVLEPLLDRGDDSTPDSDLDEEALSERYLAENWFRRIPEAVERVDQLLDQAGLSMDAVNAQTLAENIEGMERIERMLAGLEARRNAILGEIDRRRESLARPLPRYGQVQDAEFVATNQSKA